MGGGPDRLDWIDEKVWSVPKFARTGYIYYVVYLPVDPVCTFLLNDLHEVDQYERFALA